MNNKVQFFSTERRKVQRMPVRAIAHCLRQQLCTGMRQDMLSFTEDISLRGLRLVVSSKQLTIGEHMMINIESPLYFFPISVYAKLVWTHLLKNSENDPMRTEAGFEFLKIEPMDEGKLMNFIQFQSNEIRL